MKKALLWGAVGYLVAAFLLPPGAVLGMFKKG